MKDNEIKELKTHCKSLQNDNIKNVIATEEIDMQDR